MDLNTPLTPELLVNAVTAAHDTLVAQMVAVIKKSDKYHTVEELADHMGIGLLLPYDSPANSFIITAAEEAFGSAGYTATKKRKRSR